MNTTEQQIELIKAEAEGKEIEQKNRSGNKWTPKEQIKGTWFFADIEYRIEPDKPAVEEYPIVKINGQYVWQKDGNTIGINKAVNYGFVFVFNAGEKEMQCSYPVLYRDTENGNLYLYKEIRFNLIPVMAVKVRKVL